MQQSHSIKSPDILRIDAGGRPSFGGSQTWYRKFRQRMSGCGPATAANVICYLSRAHDSCTALFPLPVSGQQDFLTLLERCWNDITPGLQGVSSTTMFAEGIRRYGSRHDRPLKTSILDIPRKADKRPDTAAVFAFLAKAFDADLPVAFLNFHHGGLDRLASWHWVMLAGCTPDTGTAVMLDQGRRVEIDLALWLETTKAGGGFVIVRPDETAI